MSLFNRETELFPDELNKAAKCFLSAEDKGEFENIQ